jgi:ligand-binding sensor domain-containing protein
MKIKFLFVVLFLANLAYSQSGNYFLSHYTPDDERFDYLTFAMTQDDKGVFHFANKRGVIEFDGRNWGLISTSGPIFTLASSGQEIFAGGYNGFGKLANGADHIKAFQSLSQDQVNATQIFSSLSINGKIYFANTQSIFVLTASTGKVEAAIKSNTNEEFSGLIEIAGKPYVKSSNGIYLIEDNKIQPPNFPWSDKLEIDFSTTSSISGSPLTVLSVTGGRLFLASASGLREIIVENKEFLLHNVPISAAWVGEGLVAVGTLRGGVIFIDPQTGATKEITNYYTGLPDNEVYAMFTDRNDGLWVAHGYGFTRIAPFVPFKSFNHYSGIEGNLLCAKTFQGQSYVGTTLGLYSLVQQEITQEVYNIGAANEVNQKEKKGLFSFLRRDKLIEASNQSSNEKRLVKSMGFVFKKVGGIDGKVSQIIETDNQMLVAGNFGLASINGLKSTPIINSPVRSIYKSATLGQLLISTLDDNIKSFVPSTKGWQESHLLDTLDDYVSYIFEDKLQNIWLCGRTNVTKIETVDGAISAIEQVPFSNPTIDEGLGIALGTEVYVASGGSFHRFDIKDNVFKKYDSLPGPKKYFASAGNFWFHDGHRWRSVDPRIQASLKLEWLGLFSNIRYIAPAENESLWVITANNELFKFSGKQANQQPVKGYPLFLREVRGQQSKFPAVHSIIISQLESTVSFDFIQPDYLGMKAVEYRYQVKSSNSDWTPWATTNNVVNFSYLPSGTYKLDIQTRDLMGNVSAVEEITLEVEPPYWRRSWFYLLEVIFFGAMVYLSIRLSAGNKNYRVISQVLSMLTIIMIIQLVQTAVNNQVSFKASPVLDFFIQVALAILVLPAENYLRKFMVREG